MEAILHVAAAAAAAATVVVAAAVVAFCLLCFPYCCYCYYWDSGDMVVLITPTTIRAVPHALVAALPAGHTRAWYGKMFLPPADALMPPLPESNSNSNSNSDKGIDSAQASSLGSRHSSSGGDARLTYAEFRAMSQAMTAPPMLSTASSSSSSSETVQDAAYSLPLPMDDRYLSHVLPLACGATPMDASTYRTMLATKGEWVSGWVSQ